MIRTKPESCLKIVGMRDVQDDSDSDCDILDDFIFDWGEAQAISDRLRIDPKYSQYSHVVVEPSTVYI